MKLTKEKLGVGILLGVMFLTALALTIVPTFASDFRQQSLMPTYYASSTAKALTWGAATTALGTSTPQAATSLIPATIGRAAVRFSAINCTSGGQIWLSYNDRPAATSTGAWLNASTSMTFGQDVPMVYGAIRAVASNANCTLLIEEFRTLN